MYKKTIKYTDFDGNERTEDCYFNLTKAEVIMWLTTSGDYTLDKVLNRIVSERNGTKIMEMFEDLIRRSYGRKSLDGRKFEKSEEIWQDFKSTEAYSELFMSVVTDAKNAADFVNNIIPDEIANQVQTAIKENPDGIPDELKDYIPSEVKAGLTAKR